MNYLKLLMDSKKELVKLTGLRHQADNLASIKLLSPRVCLHVKIVHSVLGVLFHFSLKGLATAIKTGRSSWVYTMDATIAISELHPNISHPVSESLKPSII